MKVGGIREAVKFLNQAQDRQNSNPQDRQKGGSRGYEQPAEKKEEFQEILRRLQSAVDHFAKDETAHSSGLSAVLQGSGPGLKVILKDAFGNVLRTMSAEEFLKVREGGHLIDQKL